MALLDYMFPMGQPNPSITGLLGEEEAKRIRQQSQVAGLLNFGANLLANSGPTSQPMSFGQRLAPALLGGYQAAQGATNQQLQDQMTMQKLKKEADFSKAVQGAFVSRPTGTGLTQANQGSQAEMLSRPEFGGGFAGEETKAALMSNPNLPQQRVLDQNAFMTALAEYNPLEFAKLQGKEGKETFRPLTVKEKQDNGLPVNKAYQIGSSGKISEVGSGPQSVVNVLPAESARQTGYGKLGVEQNTAIFTSGQSAVRNISKIDETLDLIEKGTPTTGIGADLINNINRTKLLFTDSKKNIKEVSDTELLNSLLGADVFPQIGALGIGAKGLDTPAEREFLRQVMTGTINMNKDTLIRLTNLRKKYEEKSLNQYNEAVDSGQLDELFQFSGLPKRKLSAPKTVRVNY